MWLDSKAVNCPQNQGNSSVMGFLIILCSHQGSQSVHGTSDTQTATVQNVSVDHRRSHIAPAESGLQH